MEKNEDEDENTSEDLEMSLTSDEDELLVKKAVELLTKIKTDPIVELVPTAIKLPGVNVTAKTVSGTGIWGYVKKVEEIGEGSFGTVWKVTLLKPIETLNGKKIEIGTEVALKIQRMEFKLFDNVANEINAMRAVMEAGCPNVNQIYDVFYDSKSKVLYFILELVDGRELYEVQHSHPSFEKLHKLIARGEKFDATKVVSENLIMANIIIPLLKALDCMHKHKIAHRDIKAENIMMLNKTSTAIFIDFGLSCVTKCQNKLVGTPETIAPEIFARFVDLEDVTNWINADFWALGCTIYELITNKVYEPQQKMVDEFRRNGDRPRLMGKMVVELFKGKPELKLIPAEYPNVIRMLGILLSVDPTKRKPVIKSS